MSKRFKARLFERGFIQKEKVYFNDVFFPFVMNRSIRMLFAMVARFDLELEKIDVKTTFLYRDLDETILMKKDYMCKLNGSLYGLKQSPR